MTRSLYQVPYFEFTCRPKRALPQHVFRSARRPKCHDWCFKCLGWLCLAGTYFFAFRDTNSDSLVSLRPETRDVATRVSGRKWVLSTGLDIVNGSFCNLCALARWLALHIFATQCWWAPTRAKQLSTVAILLYRFLSCLVSQNVFHVVSALQSVVYQ